MIGAAYDLEFRRAVQSAARGLRTGPYMDPMTDTGTVALALYLRSNQPLQADGLELMARLWTGKLRASYGGKVLDNESEFARLVRDARRVWSRKGRIKVFDKEQGKKKERPVDPATTGAALAAMLRDPNRHIGPGERELLAELVCPLPSMTDVALPAGAFTLEMKGTPPKGAGHPKVIAVVQFYRARMRKATRRKKNIAKIVDYLKDRANRPTARKQSHKSVFKHAEYLAQATRWVRDEEIIAATAEKFNVDTGEVENYVEMVEEREAITPKRS